MDTRSGVRPSPIAGQWYPADPKRLSSQVDQYLDSAVIPKLSGTIIAVMAPHAGHRYSGPVAGHSFAALRNTNPEVVAVVSPMHYPYHEPVLTTSHKAYETPLGLIPVDSKRQEMLNKHLEQELGISLAYIKNDPEHSLEIELPFLQRALKNPFFLLPVMVRDQSEKITRALGRALAGVLSGSDAVLVASTDLSHFYPQSTAKILDTELLRRVSNFDPLGVLSAEEQGKGFACGRGALASVMWAALAMGADRALVLNYATSGDVTGDFTQVVGYGAAAFICENSSNRE